MNNLLIKSENLKALKELLGKYKGKIDVIPIDPPYNTDISYIEYKDHDDKWISFMKERLLVAYELLSKHGVMFINIDENEFCNLFSLCCDIFGSNNIMSMIWKKTNKYFDANRIEKPLESGVRRTHEFIVVCFKNRATTILKPIMQPVLKEGKFIEELIPLETILDNLGTTSSAKDELEELFGSRTIFSTPKPVKLIKELIRSSTDSDSYVLDFFAGSGTTGHAVMDLNKEDGGHRKFILITNNENEIFDKVTAKRIELAISKYGYKEKISKEFI